MKQVDSLRERDTNDTSHDLDTLLRVQQAFASRSDARRQRARCREFTYGNQWSDPVLVDPKNKTYMREDEYLRSIGQAPLQNNLIRRLVRTGVGVFRSQSKEPTCVSRDRQEQAYAELFSTLLQCNQQRNQMKELSARGYEEMLISGVTVARVEWGRRDGTCDVWIDNVNPDYFGFDTVMRDYRTTDATMVYEIHDIGFETLVSQFGRTAEDYRRLSDEYRMARDARTYGAQYQRFFNRSGVNDFLIPADPHVCRVIEVWTKENKSRYHLHDYLHGTEYKIDTRDYRDEVEQENQRRVDMARRAGADEEAIQLALDIVSYVRDNETPPEGMTMPRECRLITAYPYIDDYWYYRFLTPTGLILREGESPFAHGLHPYVFRVYPFTDGQPQSYVGDLIDPQKYINRSYSQIDLLQRLSAKGPLIYPESAIPDSDPTLRRTAEQWSQPNAIITYKDEHGRNPRPDQLTATVNTSTLESLIIHQEKLLEDTSGIHGALQGKPGSSSVSGVLYAQQAQNATMSLIDMLESYSGFLKQLAQRELQLILQYYDDDHIRQIAGEEATVDIDPRRLKDIIWDIAIDESTTTPAYRQLANDTLNQWLGAGLITLEQALQYGSFPGGDQLLNDIRTRQQEAAQQQAQQQAAQQAQPPTPAPTDDNAGVEAPQRPS